MKVDVDNQGWQMVDGTVPPGPQPKVAGANALDVGAAASVAPSSGEAPGSGKPSSGVYAKVAGRAAEELAVMDTMPAPSSGEPPSAIPPPSNIPADLLRAVSLDDHDTED